MLLAIAIILLAYKEQTKVYIVYLKEPECLLFDQIEEIEIDSLKERVKNSHPC